MARALLGRRSITFTSIVNSPIRSLLYNLCSRASSTITDNEKNGAKHPKMDDHDRGVNSDSPANNLSRVNLSLLLSPGRTHLEDLEIELVDPDTWRVSSGLAAQTWRETEKISSSTEIVDEPQVNYTSLADDEADFDEIEDMRIRGNLFYKLDRDSREFEEYNLSLRRKKTSKNATKERKKESQNKEKSNRKSSSGNEKKLPNLLKNKPNPLPLVDSASNKKLRTPTFNQLTGPYHEPFCLDIYISKASVRACIVHRPTSKVVAVAHSISKDMKFDLTSTKNATACAAVGQILAQRALADDIHDVIYTPRKGEKLEGKLHLVLQSVIDNGINVKVKIKQKIAKKVGTKFAA